jgi:hypothetical protein
MFRRNVFVSLTLTLLAAASLVSAQRRPAEYLQTITLDVRAGATEGFENYVKKIVEAAKETGNEPHWAMFQTTMGHSARRYMAVFYFNQWGEVDAWGTLQENLAEAYGEDEAKQILRTGSATLERIDNRVFTLLPEHSTKLDQFKGLAPHYFVVETTVGFDKITDYEALLARRAEAGNKHAGAPMAIRRRALVGPGATYVTSLPLTKMGDFDQWPSPSKILEDAYGVDEARRLREINRNCVETRDIYVISMRSDLSWWGATAPTSDE